MKKSIKKLLLLAAMLPATINASAYDFEVDGIYYNVVSLSELTCKVVWGANGAYKGDIVIPATVNYANRTLTVVEIEDKVFQNSSNLTGITIPNTISSIGNYMFNGCSKLERVVIEDGNSVLELGAHSMGTTGRGLFYDCPITTLYIGRNLSYKAQEGYGYSPFYNVKTLKELTLGNSVTQIDDYMFYGCYALTSVIIPTAVTEIGDYAFRSCWGLTSFAIPNSVTDIGDYTFESCSGLITITVGSSVAKFGHRAFHDCTKLQKVIVEDIAAWCNISFSDDSSNPLYYAHHLYCDEKTEIKDLVIPNSVTKIGSGAFYDCSGLTSVTIGNSVTEIGSDAFAYCSGLTSVTIGNSVTEIDGAAFYNCSSLTSVTIPNSVTKIDSNTFYGCNALTALYSLNTTPPSAKTSTFTNNQYMILNVYVPEEALEAYQSTEPWKNFWNLQGFDPTGIESVKSEGKNGNNVYYDLNGNRLDAPKKGLNIINGKKVIVK